MRLEPASAAITTASTAVSTTTTTAATESARAWSAWLHWAGFVHSDRTAIKICAVELRNSGLRFSIRRHFDEAETFRTTGVAIADHFSRFNRSALRKDFDQILINRRKRKISNIKLLTHETSYRLGGQ